MTIAVLSIVFFSIAAWNVGAIQYPVTTWQSTTSESFYVNLASTQQVQKVYFWVKSGNASVTVYSGSPENWTNVGEFSLQPAGTDYNTFQSCTINSDSQFLRFDVNATNYDSKTQLLLVSS